MSLESWKAEFYPVEAKDCPENPVDAIAHSLRKWEGLTPENLKKHGLRPSFDGYIREPGPTGAFFQVDSGSCALCLQHNEICENCELAEVRDGKSCDHKATNEESSPWRCWVCNSDPKPMIFWLRKAADAQH